MNNLIQSVVFFLLLVFVISLFSCSNQNQTKQDLITTYNEFAKHRPPALGEGVYPLTANFKTEDKGNEGKAQALVEVGFLTPAFDKSSSRVESNSFTDNVVTFHLTELGRKYYDSDVKGFAWGYHSALSADKLKFATISGQKTAYVTLRTKIVAIPDWAQKPVIVANYPIVKETLAKNEFHFNAIYRFVNNRWVLVEVNEFMPGH